MAKQWNGQLIFITQEGVLEGHSGSDIDVINSGIHQILNTVPGERVMEPEFGAKIQNFLFEPLDEVLMQVIRTEALLAITRWEPRIRIEALDVFENTDNEHGILIHILYRLQVGNQDITEVNVLVTKTIAD